MKKITEGEVRAVLGFAAFFGMILLMAKFGVILPDFQYMQLMTIMLSGFVAGGKR